ncbi:MAG: SPOR domain-containing protein [Lacibacter sp.]|nr:SPOR domain-containing protein [Lacibacter sp.]
MNMKQLLLFFVITCFVHTTHAQMLTDTVGRNVYVIKDSRFELLVKKKADINKKSADSKKPTKGYRIQVLNTTDRTQALSTKSKLLTLYPEQKTYLMYQAPYFKIRIGNFVEKAEADDLKKELARMFPTGVFVIPSEIEYKAPPEKEENIK